MLQWYPTWQEAALAAAALAATAALLRSRASRPGIEAFTREAATVIGLFVLWQLARTVGEHSPGGAVQRGDRVVRLERLLHLPSEAAVQNLLLPHSTAIRFFNSYYVYAHVNVLVLTLLWLFLRHRDGYAEGRTAIALTTGICLAIQLAVPVAPPRLLATGPGGHGLVDTGIAYGQSVYGPVGQGLSDQYAALPSMHVGWAAAVAWLVWRSARGAWRLLGVAHLALTVTVIVATGNHYWADGIVAALALAASVGVLRLVQKVRATSRPAVAGPVPGPRSDPAARLTSPG